MAEEPKQYGFARAIRTEHDRVLALLDLEGDGVDHGPAVFHDGGVVELEDRRTDHSGILSCERLHLPPGFVSPELVLHPVEQ